MSETQNRNMKTLKGERQVRDRPANIFGSNSEIGAAHGVDEIITNAVDEAREGYGSLIKVEFDKDGSVTVEDEGRGLPMSEYVEEESKYNWELALCTLYASGKYDGAQYGDSTGLNGLGLTATQYASEYMDVWSTYGGSTKYMHFEKGKPVGELQILPPVKEGTGTKIKFKPDVEVFPALKIKSLPADYYISMLRKQAMLHDGLVIDFKHFECQSEIKLVYNGGIVEFINQIIDKALLKNTLIFNDTVIGTDDEELYPEKYKCKMKLAFNFSKSVNLLEVYHNSSHLFEAQENYSLDALKNGFTKAFTEYARQCSKLSSKDKFVFKDIESLLICVGVTNCPGKRTWFKNQTKGAINNTFVVNSFLQFVFNSVFGWLQNNKDEATTVLECVLFNKQCREEADRISKKAVQSLTKGVSFGNKPKTLVDTGCKDMTLREIYIVEGDSASGSCISAREMFQAIMQLKGKPINGLKENVIKVISNEVVNNMYRAFGCGIEAKSEYLKDLPAFNLDNLQYNRIMICTDADVDGGHITTLLLALFYVLSPTLLKAGKVWIVMSPLYIIEHGAEKLMAYSDKEKDDIVNKLKADGVPSSKYEINRYKGLGEMDPDTMNLCAMNPETRRIVQVDYPEDDTMLTSYMNALLGDDIELRRMLIDEYFELTKGQPA